MPKQRTQISRDGGLTWKYEWIDPTVVNPMITALSPGNIVRVKPGAEEIYIGLKDGLLYSIPWKQVQKSYKYQLRSGEVFHFKAANDEEADVIIVHKLMESSILIREKMLNEAKME